MGFSVNLAPLGKAFESWGQNKFGKKIGEYKQLQAQAAQAIQLISTSPPDSPEHQRGLQMLQQVEAQVIDDPEARAELQKMSTDARIQSNIQNVQQRRPDVSRSFPQNNPRNPQVYAGTDFSLQGSYPGLGLFDDTGKPMGVGRQSFEADNLGGYYNELKGRIEDDNTFVTQVVNNAAQHLKTPESVNYLEQLGQAREFQELLQKAQSGDKNAVKNLMEMDSMLDDVRDKSASQFANKLGVVGTAVHQRDFDTWNVKDQIGKQRSFQNSMSLAVFKDQLGDENRAEDKKDKTTESWIKNAGDLNVRISAESNRHRDAKTKLKEESELYPLYQDMVTQVGLTGTGLSDWQAIEGLSMEKYGKSVVQLDGNEKEAILNEFISYVHSQNRAEGYDIENTSPDIAREYMNKVLKTIDNHGVDPYVESRELLMDTASSETIITNAQDAQAANYGRATVKYVANGTNPMNEGVDFPIDLDAPSPQFKGKTHREVLQESVNEIIQLDTKAQSEGLTYDEQLQLSHLVREVGHYVGAGTTPYSSSLSRDIEPDIGGTLPEDQFKTNNPDQITSLMKQTKGDYTPNPLGVSKPDEVYGKPEELIAEAEMQLGEDAASFEVEAETYLSVMATDAELVNIARGEIPDNIRTGFEKLLNDANVAKLGQFKDQNKPRGIILNSLSKAALRLLEQKTTNVPRDGLTLEEQRFYK